MQIIPVIGYTALFIFLIRRMSFFKMDGLWTNFVPLLFIVKVIAGCVLGLIYTYYYTDRGTADSLKFFNDSGILFDTLHSNFKDFIRMLTGINGDAPELRPYYEKMATWLNRDVLFNDNKTIIRVNTLFRFFSLGYYYVHVVFINFLSLIGFIAMLKVFLHYGKERKKEIAVFTMLLPSVLFWGSGLLKDPLLIFVFGLLTYTLFTIQQNGFTRSRFITLLVLVLSLMMIKLYVLLIIFPATVLWLFSRKMPTKKIVLLFIGGYLLYFTAAFNFHRIDQRYDVGDLIYMKQVNFYRQAEEYGAKSLIEIPRLQPGVESLVKNALPAFVTSTFRPFITDVKGNPLILLSALENLFIVLMLIGSLFYFKKAQVDGFILYCLFYLFLLFILIGLITPVLGALVRYRVPGLPFLMFLLIYFSDFPNALLNRFKKSGG